MKASEGLYEKYLELFGKKERWRLGGSFGDALKAGNIDDAMDHADDTNKQRLKLLVSNYYQYNEKYYSEEDESSGANSESPSLPFTLKRYIRDQSSVSSQIPTELRGITVNLQQAEDDLEEAKEDIGVPSFFRTMGKYVYVESGKHSKYKEKKGEHICEKLKNTVWEMSDPRRPVLPQEGLGITNTHPHCKCGWETFTVMETDQSTRGKILRPTLNGRALEDFAWKGTGVNHLGKIDKLIEDRYQQGTLHKLNKDGSVGNIMESRAEEKLTREQIKALTFKKWKEETGRTDRKGFEEWWKEYNFQTSEGTDEDDAELARDIMKDEKDSAEPLDWQHGGEDTPPIAVDSPYTTPIIAVDYSGGNKRGAKCSRCGSKNTGQSWSFSDGRRGHGKDAFYCHNCGNIFKEGVSQQPRGVLGNKGSVQEFCAQELEKVRTCNCPAKMVGVMLGGIANESWATEGEGKKIKGILAYAGVSHNQRLYLPEVLSTGDGKTLPLIFNHATHQGIENELHKLPEDIRRQILQDQRIVVGEVKLHWKPEDLTLFYEGVINNPFFISEVDKGDMAVSLGMIFDADSPKVCNVECYTVVKGGEFNEVSLVYHPGFPIASIEANESYLKNQIREFGHVVYEGIESEELGKVWESMSDLQNITLLKISGLEEKYDKAHSWENFEADCKVKLVAAYNGESVDHAMSNSQNTNEPSELPANTQIDEESTASMEYKRLSEKLDQLIENKKRPVDKAMEAIDKLIEASPAPPTGNYSGDLPNVLGVYPLQDKVKDITKISWDKHVLANRKLSILSSLKNKFDVEDKSTADTPFSKLPKKFKDALKELGFEVRIKAKEDHGSQHIIQMRAWKNWEKQVGSRMQEDKSVSKFNKWWDSATWLQRHRLAKGLPMSSGLEGKASDR